MISSCKKFNPFFSGFNFKIPLKFNRLLSNLSTNIDTSNESKEYKSNDNKVLKASSSVTVGGVYATGRRKTSVARVWIKEGSGQFIVNGKNIIDFFQPIQREHTIEPFLVSNTSGLFDVWCTVKGGGISGQAGAVRLGISRALNDYDSNYKPCLRRAGLMTRDSRRVERKKPGQKKARKQYQWVKR